MMDLRSLKKLVKPLSDRIRNLLSRGVLTLLDDSTKFQTLQMKGYAGETLDGIERFQDYGFVSHPEAGAEGIIVFPAGDRSHGIALVVGDRRYRIKVSKQDVAMYDNRGQKVHLTPDGINVVSPFKISATAPLITLVASDKVRIETPVLECTGEIKDHCDGDGKTMSSMRSVFNAHKHPENDYGGNTDTPSEDM